MTIDRNGKQLSYQPLDPTFPRATSTTITTTNNNNDEKPAHHSVALHNPTAIQRRDDDNNANANACNNDDVNHDDDDDDDVIENKQASEQSSRRQPGPRDAHRFAVPGEGQGTLSGNGASVTGTTARSRPHSVDAAVGDLRSPNEVRVRCPRL